MPRGKNFVYNPEFFNKMFLTEDGYLFSVSSLIIWTIFWDSEIGPFDYMILFSVGSFCGGNSKTLLSDPLSANTFS